MKYLGKSFSTPANNRAYVDGWESTFGEKPKSEVGIDCICCCDEHAHDEGRGVYGENRSRR